MDKCRDSLAIGPRNFGPAEGQRCHRKLPTRLCHSNQPIGFHCLNGKNEKLKQIKMPIIFGTFRFLTLPDAAQNSVFSKKIFCLTRNAYPTR
jgi:hypothetical protein